MHGTASTRPEAVGFSPERLARVDGWMDEQVSGGRLAGLLVLVQRRGQVAYLRCAGHADIARGTPVAPDTVWRIYSMTKPLASLALLMLYEDGLFQLDDPITPVLPCFRNMQVWAGEGRDPDERRAGET